VATALDVLLPGGLWVGGERRRDAALRPLNGEDEAFMLDESSALAPALRVTALLERCLVRLGPHEPVGADAVRELGAGDRQALLLHLRRLTFGERLECVLACPACEEELDLDLRVEDLLVAPYPDRPPELDAELAGVPVRFRLPTGADEEAAAVAAEEDAASAVASVLERCVNEPATVSGEVAEAIGELMGELDPQADLVLELTCAACGETASVPFDAGDFFAREIGADRDALLREIHLLALHYGWQESELVAMTTSRRRRYVAHLVEALAP
jgi:hypothetical protein